MRTLRLAIAGISFYCLYAQVEPVAPAFEVADIKLSNSAPTEDDYFTIRPGGVFIAHNAKVNELFQFAFQVRRDAISGAPAWFDVDRVDITAKAGAEAPEEQIRVMLRSLLITEFKIGMHTESKAISAFVLVVGKGPAKLHKAAEDGRADCQRVRTQGPASGGTHLVCSNMKIGDLVRGLPELAPGYIDRPVVDGTGLTDKYDFTLDWVGRKAAELSGSATIFTSVEKLGLKFEQRKVVLPAIVIDRMDRLSVVFDPRDGAN